MEFVNKLHSKVIAQLETNAPKTIEIKQYLSFKLVKPAITLPVHTPVKGIGTETKQHSNKYFLNLEDSFSISKLFA